MQESAQAALSYVRSKAAELNLPEDFHSKIDIHVHVPEGAIPKDGPSAGITMATTLVSALTRIPTRRDVAMTGEITLRGKVLPIGGVKEKVLAAHRAGVTNIILPKDNEKDLADIPKNVLDAINVFLVSGMDEVLKIALAEPLPGRASRRRRSWQRSRTQETRGRTESGLGFEAAIEYECRSPPSSSRALPARATFPRIGWWRSPSWAAPTWASRA
jgi:predicted S18 family serine protease